MTFSWGFGAVRRQVKWLLSDWRDTTGFTTTGERPQNWRETLLLLYPNSAEASKAPLTALTSLLRER